MSSAVFRTKRRVGDVVVVGGVEAAVAEAASQRVGVLTVGSSPPAQVRVVAGRTRMAVRVAVVVLAALPRGLAVAVAARGDAACRRRPRRRPQMTHQVPSPFERSNRFIRV